MRKRDALRIALQPPKLEEWDKLILAGLVISLIFALLALVLMILTRNFMWSFLLFVGFLIFLWFAKAGAIMKEWKWKSSLMEALKEAERK